jgi:predicted PurR-regulated permease PerM
VKRLAWLTLAVAATLAGLWLLWAFRATVALFLISVGVAAAARPLIDAVARPGWPRGLALLVVYGSAVAVVAGLIAVGGGALSQEFEQIGNQFVRFYDNLWQLGMEADPPPMWAAWLPPPSELYTALAGEQGLIVAEGLLGVTLSLFSVIGSLLAILIFSAYWTLDQARFERLGLSLLPAEQRGGARDVWRRIETAVGAHIRSEALQSLLAGVVLAVGYGVLGLEYPFMLAVVGALARLVPWLGPALAIVPVVALGGANPWLTALAGLYTLAVFGVLQYVVEPRLFDRRGYSSLLVVLLMLAGAELWGLVGVLVAPPLATALQTWFARYVHQSSTLMPTQIAEQIADVEQRLGKVRAAVAQAEAPLPPQTRSLVDRLEKLVQTSSALVEPADTETAGLPRGAANLS